MKHCSLLGTRLLHHPKPSPAFLTTPHPCSYTNGLKGSASEGDSEQNVETPHLENLTKLCPCMDFFLFIYFTEMLCCISALVWLTTAYFWELNSKLFASPFLVNVSLVIRVHFCFAWFGSVAFIIYHHTRKGRFQGFVLHSMCKKKRERQRGS